MNLFKCIAFIIALITVTVTSDDMLSEDLVQEYTTQLNRPAVIDAAIRYGFKPLFSSLPTLNTEYPGFTPVVEHWSDRGSAYLHYFGLGGGPGLFSIRLPDQRVIIDSTGTPLKSYWCNTPEGKCDVVAPVGRELGVTGTFNYTDEQQKTPAIDIAAYWKTQGQVETRANCIWAFTDDVSDQALTVETVTNRAAPYETHGLYGYYRIVVDFQENNGQPAGFHYSSIERLTKEQFLAQKDCLQGLSASTE